MTAPNGFPADMDPFALDTGTAERLVAGSLDAGDAPPEYRGVSQTLEALRQPPDSAELAGAPETVERIAAAVVVARRARPEPRPKRSPARAGKLAAVVASIVLTLTSGLAVAGALPESAQDVASVVLGRVGISIPTGGDQPTGHEQPTGGDQPTGHEQPTGGDQPTGGEQPTVGVAPTTAAPPSTTSELQPQPQPATNDANASAPAPSAPPADEPGGLDGADDGGTPPSTADAAGVEQSPNPTPGQKKGQSHRP
jgi:hypothetical protein